METNVANLVGMAVFAKVAETKSFSAAAERLGISKSAVSKQVTRLERSLNARLIHRTTRRLSLTEIGTAFYEHCARMLSEAEAAESVVSQLRAAPRGVLKLTTPAAYGHLQIAPAIPDLLARYPEMAVQIAMNDRPVDLAEEGFDVAIRLTYDPPPNVVARKLATVSWMTCVAPAYLERHGAPRTPQELRDRNCLFYSFLESSIEWRFRSMQGGETKVRVAGNFTANNSEAIREAALAGLGIALLPSFIVARDLRESRLQVVLGGYEVEGAVANDVYALYLPTRYVSPKVRAFVDFFVERFAPKPDAARA
jgi:DNA-binding transcriptional LysR family regulator